MTERDTWEVEDIERCSPKILQEVAKFYERQNTYHPHDDPKCATVTEARRHVGGGLCSDSNIADGAFDKCFDSLHEEQTCALLETHVWEAVVKDCGGSWADAYSKTPCVQ